jgi:hypothetical protein
MTTTRFYALGMPRTRSLWLSCLFSYGKSYCLHEYLSNTQNMKGDRGPTLRRFIPDIPGMDHVGSCDTFAYGFNAMLVGDSPMLVVHRPLDDVKRSLAKSHGFRQSMDEGGILEDMHTKLMSIRTSNYMEVDFDDLDDVDNVKAVIKFMGLDIPDWHIIKMMSTKIVTMNNDLSTCDHALNLYL